MPKQYHTRASCMGAMVGYAAGILSPALAGMLYPLIGLLGISLIDMETFAIAILTLLIAPIPQTRRNPEAATAPKGKRWQEMTFGFRYLASQPSLLTLVIAMSSFAWLNQVGEALYVLNAIGMILIGIGSFAVRRLRNAELLMPDHEIP